MSARGGKKRQKALSRSAKAGVLFPVGRMHRYLRNKLPKWRISAAAPVYQAAVIEYLTGTVYCVQNRPGYFRRLQFLLLANLKFPWEFALFATVLGTVFLSIVNFVSFFLKLLF